MEEEPMQRLLIAFLFFLLPLVTLGAKENHNPILKTKHWFEEEKQKSDRGFHRFATLSTIGPDGHPYSRMIEIVGMSQKNGILFFTHRSTNKAQHLSVNPFAALNIWLPKTLRQVSINGSVKEVPHDIAQRSWKRMPRFMKITFLASEHKGVLSSSDILEDRKAKLEEAYKEREIPMPESFVGYRLTPDQVVFYEIKPRNFPERELVELEGNEWVTCQLEP